MFAALLAASPAAAGFLHGSAMPSYPDWAQVARNWPCDKIQKEGKDVKIIGPLIVAGKRYEQHVIKDEKLIKIVDERCHLRLE